MHVVLCRLYFVYSRSSSFHSMIFTNNLETFICTTSVNPKAILTWLSQLMHSSVFAVLGNVKNNLYYHKLTTAAGVSKLFCDICQAYEILCQNDVPVMRCASHIFQFGLIDTTSNTNSYHRCPTINHCKAFQLLSLGLQLRIKQHNFKGHTIADTNSHFKNWQVCLRLCTSTSQDPSISIPIFVYKTLTECNEAARQTEITTTKLRYDTIR